MSLYDEYGLIFKGTGNSITAYLYDMDFNGGEPVYLGYRKEVAIRKLTDIFKIRSQHELFSIKRRYTSGDRTTDHFKRLTKEIKAKLKY